MEATAAINVTTLSAIGALFMALAAFTGGLLYRLGHLSSRVDQLDCRFDQLLADNARTREEFRHEMREMREENRRNHQQLLQALAHHTHDPDTGFAIFHIPPGTENPAA